MFDFRAGRALLALLALLPAACGFSRSPAEGLNFQAPPGWKASAGILGFMQFWRAPGDDRAVLMLFRSPTHLDPNQMFSEDRMNREVQDADILQRRAIKICGSQPATYVEAEGSSSRGGRVRVDAVMSDVNGSSYFAMYVRPVAAAPDPQALGALRELCSKS